MSRSGYNEDNDDRWALIRWRGAVNSAIKGKYGQAFLREMLEALDALPEKKLIAHDLVADGSFCAIGTVGAKRGIDMSGIDPECWEDVGNIFGIADALAREIMWENDDGGPHNQTPEQRFDRMRRWIVSLIKTTAT